MSAMEGAAAARRKLQAAGPEKADAAPEAAGAAAAPAAPPRAEGALGGFLRRLFGKEREAR
jgi:hypothetical protein